MGVGASDTCAWVLTARVGDCEGGTAGEMDHEDGGGVEFWGWRQDRFRNEI